MGCAPTWTLKWLLLAAKWRLDSKPSTVLCVSVYPLQLWTQRWATGTRRDCRVDVCPPGDTVKVAEVSEAAWG